MVCHFMSLFCSNPPLTLHHYKGLKGLQGLAPPPTLPSFPAWHSAPFTQAPLPSLLSHCCAALISSRRFLHLLLVTHTFSGDLPRPPPPKPEPPLTPLLCLQPQHITPHHLPSAHFFVLLIVFLLPLKSKFHEGFLFTVVSLQPEKACHLVRVR